MKTGSGLVEIAFFGNLSCQTASFIHGQMYLDCFLIGQSDRDFQRWLHRIGRSLGQGRGSHLLAHPALRLLLGALRLLLRALRRLGLLSLLGQRLLLFCHPIPPGWIP